MIAAVKGVARRVVYVNHFAEGQRSQIISVRLIVSFLLLQLSCVSLLFIQISTSVLRIPVHVIQTLIAPTLTVLSAAPASKDSLEMVQPAEVSFEHFNESIRYRISVCTIVRAQSVSNHLLNSLKWSQLAPRL